MVPGHKISGEKSAESAKSILNDLNLILIWVKSILNDPNLTLSQLKTILKRVNLTLRQLKTVLKRLNLILRRLISSCGRVRPGYRGFQPRLNYLVANTIRQTQ